MDEDYIPLNAFIKIKFLLPSGGRAKLVIRSGDVKVNGEVETRNKKKLREGDVVEYNGAMYVVSLKTPL